MGDLAVIVCLAFDHRAPSDRLAGFKACIYHCPFVEAVMEVSGTFDLIVQGRCSGLAEYTENMDLIRPQVAEFVARIETNFVAKTVEPRKAEEEGEALWLPVDGGRKRVEPHLIDKIVAEGDYMRVHVGTWNCLVHHTMQHLAQQLGRAGFIKLHRSCLVRIGFIDRLVHEGRRWKARLRDGTHVCVAKSHVHQLLRLMTGESSMNGATSSKRGPSEDGANPMAETKMHLRS